MASVKILVVEDEVIVAKDIADTLKEQRYDVPAIALSGEQAIVKAEQIQPDLVLMDIVLKGDVDGIEAAEQIRRRFGIPVLYLTAYTDEQTVKRAKITEPFGYITKPFDKRELYTNIEMALYKHKAEEEIRKLTQFQESIIDNADVWLNVLDDKGNIRVWNKAAEKISGYSKKEVIGHSKIWEWAYPEEKYRWEIFRKFKEIVSENEVVEDFETQIRCKNGKNKTISWNSRNLLDGKGNPVGSIALGRDITERKKAEEALRESEQKFRALVEQSLQGIIILQDFQIVFANPTAAKIAGLTVDEVLALTPEDIKAFIPAEERAAILQCYEERLADKPVEQNYELRLVRKNGDGFWLDVFVSQIEYLGKSAIQVAFIDITERKQAEEAYRSLVDHSLQGLAIFQKGRAVFANQAMAEITGYTVEEMLTLPPEKVQEFVHPDDRELVWSRHRGRLNGEELPERYDFRGIRKDGSTCWLELHASRIEYQGKPAIQAAYVDITERKKAEEVLQESEEKYRSLFKNMLSGFAYCKIIVDEKNKPVDFVYLEINDAFEKLTTLKRKDVVGKKVTEAIPGINDVHPELFDIYGKVALTGKGANFDIYFKPLKIWLSISVYSPQKGYFVAVFENITERKRAEDNLRESEEHYRMLAETMNDGLGVIDEKGTYVYVNNKFGEMLGYSPDDIVGHHWTAFFDEDAQKIINEQLTERKKGVAKPYELINTRKDGQKIFIRISPQAILDENGKFKGSFAIMTDITEQKKAEEQIAKLAKFPAENPNPVVRISGRGTVVYANKAGANLLKTWDCRVGKSVTDRWHELVMDSLSSGQNHQTEVQCDGRIFSLTFAPVVDANYVNVYGHDITERKKAEEELRLYGEITVNMSEGVYAIRAGDGVIVYTNPKFEQMFGYGRGELIGKHVSVINAPNEKSPQETAKEIINVLNKKGVWRGEILNIKKDGTLFWCYASVSTFEHTEHKKVWVTMHTDITERKKAEDKLLEDQAKLKAMASEMLLTEERERQRLAMGLHDEVCQKLVLTKLALESSMNLVSDSNVLASLRIVCEGIGETIEQADSLTFELSNPVLRQLGFVIALEKYLTEEIRQKYGIAFELQSDEQLGTLQDEIKNCLFRVTRELLTNIVKHAHARKVKVSVRKSQSQIYVRVQDDGVGFKESQAGSKVSQTARFGLFSIREQLEYLGGHLEIESEPGQGTKATVVVPLRKQLSKRDGGKNEDTNCR